MLPEQLSFYKTQFERTWPYLAAALQQYGETHSKDELWSMIESEKAQLHPLKNAAFLTKIDRYSSGLTELNVWLAGGDLQEIVAYAPMLEKWAKEEKCNRAVINGRRGWKKALRGFREVCVTMVKDLN